MNPKLITDGINRFIGPIITVLLIVGILFYIRKLIRQWNVRNLGTAAGISDFTNLSADVYETVGGWFSSPSDIERVMLKVNELDNSDLLRLNDKFVLLYGSKCRGGGIICGKDTTSIRTYIDGVTCIGFTGCPSIKIVHDRLNSLGV